MWWPRAPLRRYNFDETPPRLWEWDVKRFNLVMAGRANGFSSKERASVVRAAVEQSRGRRAVVVGDMRQLLTAESKS
ncbi:DUF2252 family protein [Streptomyces sp. NPDC086033]|uniref:DUF2252 family protein n=1 Tax=Streptomyces sp. NPDC086033 TaxID=3365747 RepID=UPI0037D755A1